VSTTPAAASAAVVACETTKADIPVLEWRQTGWQMWMQLFAQIDQVTPHVPGFDVPGCPVPDFKFRASRMAAGDSCPVATC
jgi:hypothetical protein